MEDHELLRRYVESGSHEAFGELVRRHIGIVHAAALRLTRDRHRADDVTQAVFVALARDARKVRRGERLSGWLLTAARYHASHLRQSESRRIHHETRAAAMTPISTDHADPSIAPDAAGAWEQVSPALDEAIGNLSAKNRDALLLRYFEHKTVREVAAALRISEDAAKQRLSRAVEELRTFFTRRGVMVSAVVLAALLSANAVAAVPPEFAAATAQASLQAAATGAGGAAATGASGKGVAALLSGAKAKAAAVLLAAAVAGGGGVAVRHVLVAAEGPPGVAAPRGAAPARQSDGSWRLKFDQVYRLPAADALKRVPPPFIPEREAYFNEIDPGRAMFDVNSPSIVTYTWNGQAEFSSWRLGQPTLQAVVGQCCGLPRYRLELPLKDRLRPVPGDWVIRPDSSTEKRMEALGQVLRTQLGWKVTFEQRQVEREVYVARGRFQYTPLPKQPDADDQQAGMPSLVHLYVESLSGERGAAIGDVHGLLTAAGELMETEVVDESTPGKETVTWRNHAGAMVPPESRDKLMDNIGKQTRLTFNRERWMVSRWFLVPAGE